MEQTNKAPGPICPGNGLPRGTGYAQSRAGGTVRRRRSVPSRDLGLHLHSRRPGERRSELARRVLGKGERIEPGAEGERLDLQQTAVAYLSPFNFICGLLVVVVRRGAVVLVYG